jgi:hypothetical protein
MVYSNETNNKNKIIGIAGIISLLFLLFSASVDAVVSIAVNDNGSKFGYCANEKSTAEAEKCAIEKCGESCKVAKTCEKIGYGAIHQNFLNTPGDQRGATHAVAGYSCGQEFPTFAANASLSHCKKKNRKSNKRANTNICFEKALWQDQPFANDKKEKNWCSYATEVTGIKNFGECVKSTRFMNPERDCAKNVKLWCQ